MGRQKDEDVDEIDLQILELLAIDARMPFTEIADKLALASGTIHLRFEKLKKLGVLLGTRIVIDRAKLGYGITAYVNVNLTQAKEFKKVMPRLQQMPEIAEVSYSTGEYTFFCKVIVKNIPALYSFLERLQQLEEIQRTDSHVILGTPVYRDDAELVTKQCAAQNTAKL